MKNNEFISWMKTLMMSLTFISLLLIFSASPIYGGLITKEILGPISVSGFGLANIIVEVLLGVSF